LNLALLFVGGKIRVPPRPTEVARAMGNNSAVIYSFLLYVLYVLLPLIPAVLIFRLFPETKVTVSGPLQNLTVNATGAFAGYVVTVALGFFLVQNVEQQIQWTRIYPVQGIITDIDQYKVFDSDRFYARYVRDGSLASGYDNFVVLLDHPVKNSEKVLLKYWDQKESSGVGAPPQSHDIALELSPSTSLQRFQLQLDGDQPRVVPEGAVTAAFR